jgi:hypothetical protein
MTPGRTRYATHVGLEREPERGQGRPLPFELHGAQAYRVHAELSCHPEACPGSGNRIDPADRGLPLRHRRSPSRPATMR